MLQWFNFFLDLIYPKTCLTCQQKLLKDEKEVCLNCLNDLAILQDYKRIKDNKVYYQIAGLVPIQGAFSGFRFDKGGKLQKLLHHLKYHHKSQIGIVLGEFLAFQIGKCPFPEDAVLVPIPLHPKKLKKRGYNQSAFIAKGLSNTWKLPINEQDFIRTEYTETQTFKSREERQQNVKNVFELLKPISHPVILVDDVITTGSTLISASKKLYEKGVNTIYVITIGAANY